MPCSIPSLCSVAVKHTGQRDYVFKIFGNVYEDDNNLLL